MEKNGNERGSRGEVWGGGGCNISRGIRETTPLASPHVHMICGRGRAVAEPPSHMVRG